MFKKILLIPTGNDPDQRGAQRAFEICRATGATLIIFETVYEPHLEGYLGDSELYEGLRQRIVNEHQDSLQQLADTLRSKGCVCEASAMWGSSVHAAVNSIVVRKDIDLVVVEPANRPGRLSRADWRLVSQCPAPVLVVNSETGSSYRHVLAAIDPYHVHGKPNDLDTAILKIAAYIRAVNDAELRVVHCFTPIADIVRHGYAELPINAAESVLEAARRDALIEIVARENLDPDGAELIAGKPDEVLASEADGHHSDLIVLGAVSRGAVKDFFIGSTAERVLEEARCDVLVIKPEGFEVRISV